MGAVFGVSEVKAALDKIVEEATQSSVRIVKRSEAVVEGNAKKQFTGAHKRGEPTTAAKGHPPDVVTGTLRRSIRSTPVTTSGLAASGMVYPAAVYARIQEQGGDATAPNWGSKKAKKATKTRAAVDAVSTGRHATVIPARPFMRPAYDQSVAEISRIAAEEWTRATSGK